MPVLRSPGGIAARIFSITWTGKKYLKYTKTMGKEKIETVELHYTGIFRLRED
jgi:hypothetical protein